LDEGVVEVLYSGDCKIGKGPFKKNARITVTEDRLIIKRENTRDNPFQSKDWLTEIDLSLESVKRIRESRKGLFRSSELEIEHGNDVISLTFAKDPKSVLETINICLERERKLKVLRRS
jgi:hypothetical protein